MAARTGYIILRSISQASDQTYQVVGTVEANSATSAIRTHVDHPAAVPGTETFVAVPARSWQPQTVINEQKTVVRIHTDASWGT